MISCLYFDFNILFNFILQTLEEAEKTEVGKKGRELAEGLGKTATKAAESVSKGGEQIAQSQVFQSVKTV